jgi:hypothetical protein
MAFHELGEDPAPSAPFCPNAGVRLDVVGCDAVVARDGLVVGGVERAGLEGVGE